MNSASGHEGQHVDCLPCEITKIARPRWWSSYCFDARDIAIIVLSFLLLALLLLW